MYWTVPRSLTNEVSSQLTALMKSAPSRAEPKPSTSNPLITPDAIIKSMALDKRKKLLAEFKAGDEPDKLADILKQILQGVPDTTIIDEVRIGSSGKDLIMDQKPRDTIRALRVLRQPTDGALPDQESIHG